MRILLFLILLMFQISVAAQIDWRCGFEGSEILLNPAPFQFNIVQWQGNELEVNEQLQFENKLVNYLHYNMKYPKLAVDNVITGHIFIQINTDTEGRISKFKIQRDICSVCAKSIIDQVKKFSFKNKMPANIEIVLYSQFDMQ